MILPRSQRGRVGDGSFCGGSSPVSNFMKVTCLAPFGPSGRAGAPTENVVSRSSNNELDP